MMKPKPGSICGEWSWCKAKEGGKECHQRGENRGSSMHSSSSIGTNQQRTCKIKKRHPRITVKLKVIDSSPGVDVIWRQKNEGGRLVSRSR